MTASLDRFRKALAALIGSDIPPLAIAVSGGPDSLALLLLAHAVCPGAVHAATVDHGLRAAAAVEADRVAAICAARAIPHDILTLDWHDRPGHSLQQQARALRYAALAAWCRGRALPWLLTAHHADDQAETVLMRLNRGAGVAGLAGIRARRPIDDAVPVIQLARPLLGFRKAELAAIVADAGLHAVDDPSNRDARFDRTAARAVLAATDWLDADRLVRSAAHLADAEAALDWATDIAWGRTVTRSEAGYDFAPGSLPAELLRRVLIRILAAIDPGLRPRGPDLQRMTDRLSRGESATLGSVHASPGTRWRFAPAPPRRRSP